MFVGHLGAGLLLKRADRRVSLGLLLFAALFADLLLGILSLLGVERIIAPADYPARHYLTFIFPYSHGLLATLGWSGAAFLAVWIGAGSAWNRRARAGVAAASAVFSHFVLDALVHIPELPLLGQNSPKLGLGLWDRPAVALGLEILIAGIGLSAYLHATVLPRAAKYVLLIAMTVAGGLSVAGLTVVTAPPGMAEAAGSMILSTLVFAALGLWVDRTLTPRPAGAGSRPAGADPPRGGRRMTA